MIKDKNPVLNIKKVSYRYADAKKDDYVLKDINYSLFNISRRYKEKRPVWIFKGDSGMGKTYLSSIIYNNSYLQVYETDSERKIKDALYEDIIVIGNKYEVSIEEVEKRILGPHETIIVDFSSNK